MAEQNVSHDEVTNGEPTKCSEMENCFGMQYAIDNPITNDLGLRYQLVVNLKSHEEGLQPVYYMRRNLRKGDKVLKILFCPFCGAELHYKKLTV